MTISRIYSCNNKYIKVGILAVEHVLQSTYTDVVKNVIFLEETNVNSIINCCCIIIPSCAVSVPFYALGDIQLEQHFQQNQNASPNAKERADDAFKLAENHQKDGQADKQDVHCTNLKNNHIKMEYFVK